VAVVTVEIKYDFKLRFALEEPMMAPAAYEMEIRKRIKENSYEE